jgi:hypothetical protein
LYPQDACAAIESRFAELLADSGWLPDEYQAAAPESGMGGGIGQWLLYRADDGSLLLFSLVVPSVTNDTGCVWRHAWDTASGQARPFRSGYVNVACDH